MKNLGNFDELAWTALPTTSRYSKQKNKVYNDVNEWINENIYNSGMLKYCFAKDSNLTEKQQKFLRLKLKNRNDAKKFYRWAEKVQITL